MKIIKENWKFLFFVLIGSLIGGYCVGLYAYDSFSIELLKQLQEHNITKEMLAISTMLQYGIIFGLVLAIIGIFFSKKANLWKKFEYNKNAFILTAIITVISALLLFPGDKLFFGSFSSWVNEQYSSSPTLSKILSGLLTGGITEEIMMRLFFMSLLVVIISKLFFSNSKEVPLKVYVIANIITATIFAAGHIPSTMGMTTLTPLLLFRCFLLNGGIGLGLGYLYRKYGIGYAIMAHGFAHLIADTLLIIFV